MNESKMRTCPHCGSGQLVAHPSSRKVFIDHQGERIPLLTANYNPGRPFMEEHSTTYTCTCSWAGSAAELQVFG